MVPLLVMYVATGLLLSALSVPLILRKIGPNPVYGSGSSRHSTTTTSGTMSTHSQARGCSVTD